MAEVIELIKKNALQIKENNGSGARLYAELKAKPRPVRRRLREPKEVAPRDGIPIHEQDTDNCTALWQSIIVQAMYDLVGEGGSYHRRQDRAEALAWFGQPLGFEGTDQSDFEMVCDMAELTPSKVKECAKKCRKEGVAMLEGFNFRSLRKDSSIRKGRKV